MLKRKQFFLLFALYSGLLFLANKFDANSFDLSFEKKTSAQNRVISNEQRKNSFSLLLAQPLWATEHKTTLGLSAEETKALRREMVEMDLAVRNLSSVLSMGYRITLRRNLQYLSKLQTLNNHKYQTTMKSVIKKLKAKNVYGDIEAIQNEANNLLQYLNKYQNSNRHWDRVNSGYTRILDRCRACHEKTILE